MGIDDEQGLRPQQFGNIKPQGLSGNDDSFKQSVLKADMRPARVVVHTIQPNKQRDEKQRRGVQHIPPGNLPLLPPSPGQQHRRQSNGHSFAQQRGDIAQQQLQISSLDLPGLAPLASASPPEGSLLQMAFLQASKSQPGHKGQQIKHRGQQIFAGGNPHHRLHMHRMHSKQRSNEPSPRQTQEQQDTPQQQTVDAMQQQIRKVKTGRVETPEFVVQPKRSAQQWPIVQLIRCCRIAPNIP